MATVGALAIIGALAITGLVVASTNATGAIHATTVQDYVSVWVNAGPAGSDANSGLSQVTPVKTIQQAMSVLQQYSGKSGYIELDGTTTHDWGTDPILDFFPLIARYGNIVFRGRRTNVQTGNVTSTFVDVNEAHGFVQLTTTTNLTSNYATQAIQNLNTSRVFVVESNIASTIDVVGSNYGAQDFAIIWSPGDYFEIFTASSIVTWTGHLQVLASFSRVNMEAINFLPATNASQFVAPKYRDDAMIFRACQFTVKGVASYDYGEFSETGLPLEADPRPTFRGSI